jgi:integrase
LPFRAISDVWVDRYKRATKNAASKATANGRVSALRRLFVFAKKRGFHTGTNPAEKPELYKLDERLTIWERDEEERFLSAVRVRKLGSPFGRGKPDKRKLDDPDRPTTEDRLPVALAMGLKLGVYTGQRIGDIL